MSKTSAILPTTSLGSFNLKPSTKFPRPSYQGFPLFHCQTFSQLSILVLHRQQNANNSNFQSSIQHVLKHVLLLFIDFPFLLQSWIGKKVLAEQSQPNPNWKLNRDYFRKVDGIQIAHFGSNNGFQLKLRHLGFFGLNLVLKHMFNNESHV